MSFTTRQGTARKRPLALLGATALSVGVMGPLAGTANADNHVQDLAPACEGLTDPAGFADIAFLSQNYQDAINCMAHYDITQGRSATQYAPNLDVKRYEMALFISRSIDYIESASTIDVVDAGDAADAGFDDLEGVSAEATAAINRLAELDIVEGKVAGEVYAPMESVNRRDMARFINRLQTQVVEDAYTAEGAAGFPDVPATMAGAADILNLQAAGIVQGTTAGTYVPFGTVRRADMALYIMRHLADNIEAGNIDSLVGQPEPGPAANIALDPAEAVNPVGTDHTVTASLTDENDVAVADDTDVRFEVYNADTGEVAATGAVAVTADGDASFTYTGPDAARDDLIVACAAITRCITDAVADLDPITGDVLNLREDVPTAVAAKEWQLRQLAGLTLAPETDTNTTLQPSHTVVAATVDQFGDPIYGQTVTFEVFRDADEAEGADDTGWAFVTEDTAANVADNPATTETDETVEASFTYDRPASGTAEDMIVACVEGDDADTDCATIPAVTAPALPVVVVDEDEDFVDTATKTWVTNTALALALTPETDSNPTETGHTVTATVTDAQGDPVNQPVRFEVYRDVAGDDPDAGFAEVTGLPNNQTTGDTGEEVGEADFTYTGPDAEATDTIIACILGTETGDDPVCATAAAGAVVTSPDAQAGDTATKTWVAETAAASGTFADAAIVDCATDTTTTAVTGIRATAGTNLLGFEVQAGDELLVNGEAATAEAFATACATGNVVDIDYDISPFGESSFDIAVPTTT